MVSTTPSKAYGKQFWLILVLSPATRAGTAEEKQPPGALTANKLAAKHSKSGELQGGAEMHLIGNKQLGLGGQGAQAAAGQTMQKACVINLFSPPSCRKPYSFSV